MTYCFVPFVAFRQYEHGNCILANRLIFYRGIKVNYRIQSNRLFCVACINRPSGLTFNINYILESKVGEK